MERIEAAETAKLEQIKKKTMQTMESREKDQNNKINRERLRLVFKYAQKNNHLLEENGTPMVNLHNELV